MSGFPLFITNYVFVSRVSSIDFQEESDEAHNYGRIQYSPIKEELLNE